MDLTYQLEKVERLYQSYQEAQAEIKAASALLSEAQAKLNQALEKASVARDTYNQALAEYSYQLKSHAIQRNQDQ